jgi:preprotein translocase subunit SecG
MELVLLIVHLFIALALVGVILLQKSEGGALGIGGGGGMGGFLTARGAANLLTRTTTILAALFIITSLALAVIAAQKRDAPARPPAEQPARTAPETPAPAPGPSVPSVPERR